MVSFTALTRKVTVAATAALALTLTSVASPALAADDDTQQSDRVLQSVDVGLGADGSINTISDTQISLTYSDKVESSTTTKGHDPAEVMEFLPVRVLTTYSTPDSRGTDLNDLAGYTGRVTIQLSIQNLTLEPEEMSYDVGGQGRRRVELVGAPLTVVASTNLGISPGQVVTGAPGSTDTVTNGVLSQDEEGNSQLQWATILAPPQLPASTTFTVVADVEDFTVPEFDLTVQPGYVSDPSMGQLVAGAFGPRGASETKLIGDTITLMTELDGILSETGTIITEARQTLQASADTVGTKTIADLQQSIASITASTDSMRSTLEGLNSAMTTVLQTSNSAVTGQIQSTTAAVSALIGNPEQSVPRLATDGQGCSVVVDPGEEAQTIYGSLLKVSALLGAYADATQQCQGAIQQQIVDILGPDIPTDTEVTPETVAELCQDAPTSVTCQLYSAKEEFASMLYKLGQDTAEIVAGLDGNAVEQATDSVANLHVLVAELDPSITTLEQSQENLDEISEKITQLETELDNLNRTAQLGQAAVNDMVTARQNIHNAVCAVVPVKSVAPEPVEPIDPEPAEPVDPEPAEPVDPEPVEPVDPGTTEPTAPGESTPEPTPDWRNSPLTKDEIDEILKYVSNTSCYGERFRGPAHRLPTSLETLANDNLTAWNSVVVATSRIAEGDNADQFAMLVDLKAAVADYEASLQLAISDTERVDAITQLREDYATLEASTQEAVEAVNVVNLNYQNTQDRMENLFEEKRDDIGLELYGVINESIGAVSGQRAQTVTAIDAAFMSIINQMNASAGNIATTGAITATAAQAELTDVNEVMTAQMQEVLDIGLQGIEGNVSNAVVDLQASNALLTDDIQRVLNDIGVNSVEGSGLLGIIASSAASTSLADTQIATVSETTTEFANLQRENLGDNKTLSAQTRAAAARYQTMPPFATLENPTIQYTTVYSFTLGGDK